MSEDINNNIPEDIEEGEIVDNIIVLNDEDGNEVEFELLDLIEYEGEEYVVLLPTVEEGEEQAEEVLILKYEEDEDEEQESYTFVEDENILNNVFEIFKEKFKDEFNFIDE